ncbi:MAG: hypothetical protein HQ561_05525 [Desulfobacteraceae bacterium]|nr:hypothetical protein [Desulfobacteraceae bacterium]
MGTRREKDGREGLTKGLDTLPNRFFKEPLNGGPCQGRVAELGELLEEYYLVRGWNPDGRPRDQKLKEFMEVSDVYTRRRLCCYAHGIFRGWVN